MLSPTLAADPIDAETAFSQLRHQTKNALQRILCQIAQCRDLQSTVHGARLVSDLERRVRLSSAVSDALFGLTSRPGPLLDRLQLLADATVELLSDPDQLVRVEVAVDADLPRALDDTVLRIAHEFIANAIKHGLYARSVGAVSVKVVRVGDAVKVEVLDDGWGFCEDPGPGEGMRLAAIMAKQHGGGTSLVRRNGLTVAGALLHLQ